MDEQPFIRPLENSRHGCSNCIPKRHIVCLMSFLGFFFVYSLRVNLSVALVAMVNQTDSNKQDNQSECPHEITNSTKPSKDRAGEFDWDTKIQGIILGSFFYGYITTQLPGGWLAEKYGGKLIFGLGILCTSVLTLLTPIAARTSWILLVALRIVEGIGEGVTFPAMHAIYGRWAPPLERSKLGSITYSGAHMGTVIALPISGILCNAYGFAGGWPSVFYLFGTLSCVWCFVWFLLIHDTPASHPSITYEEKNYIETALGHHEGKKYSHPPWKDILKSWPNYAIVVSHTCNNWGFYTLLTCLPTYMKEILHFNIQENSILSAVPYLMFWIVGNIAGQVTDYLRYNGYISTTVIRKILSTAALLLPAACMIGLGFVHCDWKLTVAVVTLAVGFNGFCLASYSINHLDISAVYAGTLMGISNSFATIPGMVGPYVVGLLTADNKTQAAWQKVFYISAAIYIFGAIFYLIFGSGETQYWNSEEDSRARLHSIQQKDIQYHPIPMEDDKDDDDGDDDIKDFEHKNK